MTAVVEEIILRPFVIDDVDRICAQAAQVADMAYLKQRPRELWKQLINGAGDSFAYAAESEGRLLGFAGACELWPGRLQGWAVLSSTVTHYEMLWIHRASLRVIRDLPKSVRRVEITVDEKFWPGHRWAKLLGFAAEGMMKAYDAHGNSHVLYSLIRG